MYNEIDETWVMMDCWVGVSGWIACVIRWFKLIVEVSIVLSLGKNSCIFCICGGSFVLVWIYIYIYMYIYVYIYVLLVMYGREFGVEYYGIRVLED